eukprot:scaffold71515_cov32-Tisochrysis_lutea.AAC.8
MLLPLLTVLCAPRPLLPHARPLRLPQFASVPTNLAGCDASIHGAFLVHQGAPFHHVECVGGVLLVDGVWVSSGQLGVTRALSFYHAPSDAYVVVAEFPPVGTATNVPVAGRTGTIYLRANNFTRLYATSLPPQVGCTRSQRSARLHPPFALPPTAACTSSPPQPRRSHRPPSEGAGAAWRGARVKRKVEDGG